MRVLPGRTPVAEVMALEPAGVLLSNGPGDPNRKREGVYRIPAFSLLAKCEVYAPEHLLTFLPFEERFAAFDCDHAIVTVFTSATWADIVSNPLLYLNAPWERKPAVPHARDLRWWERYAFYPGACE